MVFWYTQISEKVSRAKLRTYLIQILYIYLPEAESKTNTNQYTSNIPIPGGSGVLPPIYKLVRIIVWVLLHVYLNFGHILNAPAILFYQITLAIFIMIILK